jgi:amino acid transporter
MKTGNSHPSSTRNRFSTFSGVFTPSILTILGVIMFLRTGFVVGQAGILSALVVLLVAEAISLLTALSLAGISTNTPVKGGGAYYLISRVLGPGFGGSIGLALFLAQALSVPFYILGFTEALVQSFPVIRPWFPYISMGTAVVLFGINIVGTSWAIKTQYVVMALLGLSIVSFLGGALWLFRPEQFAANWQSGYTGHYSFWAVFAIYFPAVTGIMAGVNMSKILPGHWHEAPLPLSWPGP